MSRLPEYDRWDAVEMAARVAHGDVTPGELLEAAIERASRWRDLNAVVTPLYERARQRTERLPAGPMRGVPFLLKDLKLQLEGTVTTDSTRLRRDRVAPRSSVLAERYEAAGLQIVGKTNTPEFGIMGITEPALRGACRNPWNLDHTPGGSSGGSASAVAAGIVPAAHAGDGGGSSRIAASHRGLVGLSPSRGRVTMAPFIGEAWCGFVQEHVVCRTVRDSAAFLDIEDPPTPGEPYAAPHKAGPWIDEVAREPGTLRIAFSREALFAGSPHADCEAAVDAAATLLRSLGHEVEEATPPFPREALVRAYFQVVSAGVARMVDEVSAQYGKKPTAGDFEPATWLLARIGWANSAADLIGARWTIERAARDVAAFFERYDVFVTSTAARPPARVGELSPSSSETLQARLVGSMPVRALLDLALDKMAEGKLAYTPNTQLFNQTGQPAISLPLATSADGLPIGVQFVGRFGDEATLFRLAAQLEQAAPWAERRPNPPA